MEYSKHTLWLMSHFFSIQFLNLGESKATILLNSATFSSYSSSFWQFARFLNLKKKKTLTDNVDI